MREPADISSGQRTATRPPAAEPPRLVALDPEVLRWFGELALRGGTDPEALINSVLRDYMGRSGEPLERTLRRVLREELRKAG
ncbi:MAG TPA: hypothetical protein VMU00_07790 [Steroidobacteraceae bacterium]|nr:hypothetical protein [Steroidobacteraceae bacterium]